MGGQGRTSGWKMLNDLTTLIAIFGGWLVAGYLWYRDQRRQEHVVKLLALADQAVAEAAALAEGIYRIRLSCPVCDWTATVVRETREAGLAAGQEQISAHNLEAGHALSGTPRTGYYKGEPLN